MAPYYCNGNQESSEEGNEEPEAFIENNSTSKEVFLCFSKKKQSHDAIKCLVFCGVGGEIIIYRTPPTHTHSCEIICSCVKSTEVCGQTFAKQKYKREIHGVCITCACNEQHDALPVCTSHTNFLHFLTLYIQDVHKLTAC